MLVSYIIRHYFNDTGCILIFRDEICQLNFQIDIPLINVNLRNGKVDAKINFNQFGCQGIIICTEKAQETFTSFEYNIKFKLDRLNKRRYFIIAHNNDNSIVKDIFSLQEIKFVSDIVVMTKGEVLRNSCLRSRLFCTSLTSIDFFTHAYVGRTDSNRTIHLDRWYVNNSTFKNSSNLYPDKLKNQEGRLLRCSTFTYLPYTVVGNYFFIHFYRS